MSSKPCHLKAMVKSLPMQALRAMSGPMEVCQCPWFILPQRPWEGPGLGSSLPGTTWMSRGLCRTVLATHWLWRATSNSHA